MHGRSRRLPLDATIEGAQGSFRVRLRDSEGTEHVREFASRGEARRFLDALATLPVVDSAAIERLSGPGTSSSSP